VARLASSLERSGSQALADFRLQRSQLQGDQLDTAQESRHDCRERVSASEPCCAADEPTPVAGARCLRRRTPRGGLKPTVERSETVRPDSRRFGRGRYSQSCLELRIRFRRSATIRRTRPRRERHATGGVILSGAAPRRSTETPCRLAGLGHGQHLLEAAAGFGDRPIGCGGRRKHGRSGG